MKILTEMKNEISLPLSTVRNLSPSFCFLAWEGPYFQLIKSLPQFPFRKYFCKRSYVLNPSVIVFLFLLL